MRLKLHAVLAAVVAMGLVFVPGPEGATAAPSNTITVELCSTLKFHQITGTVYRRGEMVTVDVANYKIFDLRGAPRTDVVAKVGSGVQRIKWSKIKSLELTGNARLWDYNSKLMSATYVVTADITLTDGTVLEDAEINAHWGVIEGDTELGKFFVGNALTVSSLTFNNH